MKISELIEKLQKELDKNGDREVVVNGNDFCTNAIRFDYAIWYYDGGVTLMDPKWKGDLEEENCPQWYKSKHHPELGESYLHISCDEPDLLDGDFKVEKTYIPPIPNSSVDNCDEFDKLYERNLKLYRKA